MRRHLVALIALLAVACGVSPEPVGPARFLSAWTFEPDKEWLGGFSGLDSPDGQRFAMVSDQGYYVLGRFRREDGRITGFDRFRVYTQAHPPGRRHGVGRDAEGLVWDGGRLAVSREGVHEVWRNDDPAGPPEVLPRHPDFVTLPVNKSLEALAGEADGTLLTLPETARGGVFQLYRWDGADWRRSAMLSASDGFSAVGADIGPDGWFYLLERRLHLPFRFSSRVRRFRIESDRVLAEETVLRTAPGVHDNLEGLTVWRDARGDLRLTMVSDDNFLRMQRTEFVEYVVPPALNSEIAKQ